MAAPAVPAAVRSTSPPITDYLGITAAQLRTQQEAGKSLAAIATAQGKTVSGLEDAIVAAATKKLDADVTAGKLTAAQEATMLADLKSHVDDMVNRTGPPAGGPRGHHGPPPGFAPSTGSGSGSSTTTRRTARSSAEPRRPAESGRRRLRDPMRRGPWLLSTAEKVGADAIRPHRAPIARRSSGVRHRFATVDGFGYLRCRGDLDARVASRR